MGNIECTTLSLSYPTLEELVRVEDIRRRIIEMDRIHSEILLDHYKLMMELGFRFYPCGEIIKEDLDLEEFRKDIDPTRPPKFNINPFGKEDKDEDSCTG